MKTKKSEPDLFERDIIKKLKEKHDNTPPGKWPNPLATHDVKKDVGEVAREKGYKVRATDFDGPEQSEWLYDLTCLKFDKDDYLEDIPLVMESEWKNKYEIRKDFEKLLVSRAKYRVMVLQVKSDEEEKEIVEQLRQCVEKCQCSMKRDRYLFACWNSEKRLFNCIVYEIIC